ncbi:hypothetical protein Tco_0910567 [Tanacetum coccineum]|uniref:Reverse transcriptase Ty1/copia-type domain-containing protein n=1 Tax=Tanacetum coccineum TaxID=301880 RepID=A0ABQ5CUY9_9ASTR
MDECVFMSTPMATERLYADLQGTPTDQMTYRRMIVGLMYLTASRPDIAFATFVCARYQARPTVKHLKEVKRIFRYLRQSYNIGLWYPKDFGFELIAYSDTDHVGCKDDYKSTSGGLQFLGEKLEDGSKFKLSFMLDMNELTMTLDDFRTIFHFPQATDNNHDCFVPALKFLEMVPFYINNLGFTLELRSPSNFKTTGLVQPWQTLCKMFTRCLTTRVTGYDQPPLQIIFTKLIVSYYITAFPEILRRARDKYHNLEDDEMVKSIFNSRMNKAGVGMKISSWMITDEMKLTENYWMTTSALRTPNLDVAEGESNASRKSTVIRLYTIQLSLAEQKSHEELEAKQNEDKVKEHLMAEEIEKLVEGMENVEENKVDSSTLRKNDNQNDHGTRLEPMSNNESLEVEITIVVQPVNVNEEEEESEEDDYELKRREKGKHVEEPQNTPSPTTIRSPRIHSTLTSLDTEKLQDLTVNDPPPSTPSSSSPKPKLFASQHILSLFKPKTGHFK